MRIGINGYEAVISRVGYDSKSGLPVRAGSSKYAFELLHALYSLNKKNEYLIFLPAKPTKDLPSENEKWRYEVIKPQKMWTVLGLGKTLLFNKYHFSVFLSPTHYAPMMPFIPSVISIMDLSYELFPSAFAKTDLYQLKFWTRFSVTSAKKVLCISQATKNDILKYYKSLPGKIIVTYPGLDYVNSIDIKINMNDIKKKYNITGDYLLFVGTIQPRKNIAKLIEAFSKLKRKDLQLVIVGKPGWLFEEIYKAPEKFSVENQILFLDKVTDEELAVLYKNALCFVLPSLYEGFGLPVLEAMKNGCPVITSNVSSLPEAGGNAALYVNPNDADDITQKMALLIKDQKLRSELIKKGYDQIKKFSWEKTARETLKVLEEVAGKTE